MRTVVPTLLVVVFCSTSAFAQTSGSKLDPGEAARAKELVKRTRSEDLPYPRHRLVLSNLTALRFNPIGLEDQVNLTYRYRL
ncbi:MAG: hypothetical protein AAF658_19820, partial [Myxococcota bacterium]